MDSLIGMFDPERLIYFFGEAASSEFAKTCAIFGFAALVHSKQVRKEIRTQFGELVSVLRADLDAQQSVLGKLGQRVDNIESQLRNRGDHT